MIPESYSRARALRSALMERDNCHRVLTDPVLRNIDLEGAAARYIAAERRLAGILDLDHE